MLADRPTAAECDQMLSFGATACLSKETEARDVINAIHLASRGMHVLPRSAASGGGAEDRKLGISSRRDLARLGRPEPVVVEAPDAGDAGTA